MLPEGCNVLSDSATTFVSIDAPKLVLKEYSELISINVESLLLSYTVVVVLIILLELQGNFSI